MIYGVDIDAQSLFHTFVAATTSMYFIAMECNRELPRTRHPPSSFVVLLPYHSPSLLSRSASTIPKLDAVHDCHLKHQF